VIKLDLAAMDDAKPLCWTKLIVERPCTVFFAVLSCGFVCLIGSAQVWTISDQGDNDYLII
jgi:hypothetical protein